ncbi:DUF3027 domain-containing protein [Pseudoduganella sp. FT26W]|uniref:DUF3027 domain-containing protein n=1 Tax=Duganella aquatilis TaxID=2666082 RepID=A0A844D1D2_9BURK|nr:DUF3027 domain-containing protein [Duganella aquatilis]MRW84771.1 DUF3027 domain-containing protein [Duganella aquatilis]
MPDTSLTLDEANLLIRPLVHMAISLPWKGRGSAIFLELGNLASLERPRQRHQNGEATIYIGWDWRVEAGSRVLYGSSNSQPEINDGIDALVGITIQNITIQGSVPELSIEFSNGARLMSAAMCTDTSEWSIRLPGAVWISCVDGIVYVGDGVATGLAPEDQAVFEHARITAKRWGVAVGSGQKGRCDSCTYMIRLDGNADFLDYGVCTSVESPFDGRVVNMASGCASFALHEN